jgi:excisionase family DNA binding protein
MNLDELRDSKAAALTVTKVASLFDTDERTVRRACAEGQLPCIRIGRLLRIPTEPLRQLLCPSTPDMSADPAPTGPSTTTEPAERAFTHHDLTKPLRSA